MMALPIATSAPAPTSTPAPAPITPDFTRNDSFLGTRVTNVDANFPAFYLYEPQSGALQRLGAAGEWAPNALTIAGSKCCAPGLDGIVLLDLARRQAFDLGLPQGDVEGWTPAGDAFLFIQRDRQANSGSTYLIAADGSGATPLPVPAGAYQVLLRPGRQEVAYATAGGVLLVDLTTGVSRELAAAGPGGGVHLGAWSPTGRYLEVFASTSKLLEVDTMREVPLPANCCLFFWSPDGHEAAVVRFDEHGHNRKLFILDEAEFEKPQLTLAASLGSPHVVAWSPEGRYFAYINDGCASGDWSIHRVDVATGTNITLAGANGLLRLGLSWSRDGRYLAYAGYDVSGSEAATRGMYLFDLWQGMESEIARVPDEASVRGGDWSPDGRFLSFYTSGGFGICDG
jgi:dipeptidyl aminopeptidase/acylaminoacyl peptidase